MLREPRGVALAGLAALLAALAGAAPAAAITPTLNEFSNPTPSAQPTAIEPGPDGNLWFLEYANPGGVARITPAGAITQVATGGLTSGLIEDSHPAGLVAGPDGNLWFIEQKTHSALTRINPTTGMVAEVVSLGEPGVSEERLLDPLAVGPEGKLWLTQDDNPRALARVPTSGAPLEQFHASGSAESERHAITAGPEGDMWFTASRGGTSFVGAVSPLTGAVAEFSSGLTAGGLFGITAGPESDVWFTEAAGPGKIGKVSPEGSITEVASGGTSPGFSADSDPHDIVEGPDGFLWFTEASEPSGPGRIGRLNPAAGTVEEFPLPTPGSEPDGITVGPDGNIWFTEFGANQIGQITTPPAAAMTNAGALDATSASVTGVVNGHAQATTAYIEYGPLGGSMLTTLAQALPASAANSPVAAVLTGLLPETAYAARIIAINPTGTSSSLVTTFVTPRTSLSYPLVLSGVHESAKKWRAGAKLPRTSARKPAARREPPVGSTFSFLLNGKASVRFLFTQSASGRLVGHKCVASSGKSAKRKVCTLSITRGELRVSGHVGTNRVAFQGRISRSSRLASGTYTVFVSASNSAGQHSASHALGFTIVK